MFSDPGGVQTPLSELLAQSPVTIPADWGQGRTAFGGLSALLVCKAMEQAARPDTGTTRPLRSITVHFVGPVGIGPVNVEAEVLRTGRYMTQTHARLSSGGMVALTAQGAHGAPRPSQLVLRAAPAPELPAPESLPQMPWIPGLMPAFTQHIEYRWATENFPFSGSPSAHIQGWCRARSEQPTDTALVLMLIDAWPAGILATAPIPTAASSVMWMVNFFHHAPLPAGVWLKTEQRSTISMDGYAENVAEVWTVDGALVARSRQLVTVYA